MNTINLKLFFRKIVKDRLYFAINTIGLSFGIAIVFILFLWIMYEYNYDRFHKNFDNIHLVSYDFEFSKGVINHIMETPGPLAGYLAENYPEVKTATTCQKFFKDKYVVSREKKFQEKGYAVNSSFFDIFSIDFVKGDKVSSFESSNSIAISESLSYKLFNNNTPIGEKVTVEDEGEFLVSAVFKDLPNNSSIKFDYLLTMSYIKKIYNDLDFWHVLGYSTFVLLDDNTDVNVLNKKFKDILVDIDFGEISKSAVLTPLKDFHFDSDFGLFVENPGDIKNTYVLILLAFFILLISIVNYINLSIARSSLRLKEIGIKQTLGAIRIQLIKQFFTESLFFICFASIVSIIIVYLVIPQAQIITGKVLMDSFIDYRHVIGIFGIVGVSVILAGLYPSFYLSSLKPLDSVQKHTTKRSMYFSKSLVLTQFILVLFVTICVFSIYKQVSFMMEKGLGYNKENLVRFNLGSNKSKAEEIKGKLLQSSYVKSVTLSDKFTNLFIETSGWDWEENDIENLTVYTLGIGTDFAKTLNTNIIKGSDFSENEDLRFKEVIINETAMKFMGIDDCIGMKIRLQESEYRVVGVIKDFSYKHSKHKIKPLLLLYSNELDNIFVRINGSNQRSLEYIETVYNEFNTSDDPFYYSFISDDIVTLYGDENQLKMSISFFLTVLLFMSMIATIGMMTSHISNKNKEIGLRKVFGAQNPHIVLFLLKNIVKIVVVAYIIAIPIAVMVLNKWLNSYANHAKIGFIAFITIGVFFILLVSLVLLYQSIKASKMSPIRVLSLID